MSALLINELITFWTFQDNLRRKYIILGNLADRLVKDMEYGYKIKIKSRAKSQKLKA